MTFLRRPLLWALATSIIIHLTVVAMTVSSKPEIEIEGGGDIQHAVLGESPFNAVVAGSTHQVENAEAVQTERIEAEQVSQAEAIAPPDAAAKVATPAISTVEPVPVTQTVTTPVKPVSTPPLSLAKASQDVLALRLVTNTETETVEASVEAAKTEAASKLQPAVTTGTTEPRASSQTEPVKNEEVAKAKQVKTDQLEETLVETTKPIKPDQVIQALAEAVPSPPVKPKQSSKKSGQTTADEKTRTKTAKRTEKPEKENPASASKSGAGGKSARTAQKGGSQRAGKDRNSGNSDTTNYPAKVYRKLLRSVRSPRNAGRVQRDAIVRFTVNRNGSVSGVRLARSSGSKAFDQAVLKAVQKAAPFPPIPSASGRNNWTFSLPVNRR